MVNSKILSLWLLALATLSGATFFQTSQRAAKSASVQAGRPCPKEFRDDGDGDFRLTLRMPNNCSRSDCSLFVGLSTSRQDPSFLDVVLEGAAEGWVAVGFSETKDMFGTDVLGCRRDYSSNTNAMDTWNPYKATGRTNILDDDQSGICQYNASYIDGRLACKFSRLIEGVKSGQDYHDFNLNGQFYALFGMGQTPATSPSYGLTFHGTPHPSISNYKLNPALSSGSLVGSNIELILTKTHGILMVVAWPVLAVTGAYFSAFMKPALPNGAWFQVHRALMVASLFLAASAFTMIFVSNRNDSPRGLMDLSTNLRLSHFIIGITVMTLHLANPMIALFRCKPDGRFRWIFNILHGKVIGYLAMLLAAANITLGLVLFTGSLPGDLIPFILHLSLVGCCVLLFLIAHFIFNLLPLMFNKQYKKQEKEPLLPQSPHRTADSRNQYESGKSLSDAAVNVAPLTRRRPSVDSVLRWAGLLLLLLIVLPVSTAVCVYIGLSHGTS